MVQTLWDSITQSITGAPSADDIRRRREDESAFSSLYDAARQRDAELAAAGRRPVLGGLLSKEPVAGMDTLRYEGITPLILNLLSPVARAVDAPMAAYQGNIPMQDMAGEALGTAGMAALGGAALTRPAGSVGMGGRVGGDDAARQFMVDESGSIGASSPFANMTRETFLGNPRITGPSNAADLKPKALRGLEDAEKIDFPVGKLTARYDDSGAAVYDGDKVVASYNFGDTLVVDPKYRKQGIGEELVYQWRTRFPAPAATKTRTKVSQRIQENVWDRIQRELTQSTPTTRPATPLEEAHPGGLLTLPFSSKGPQSRLPAPRNEAEAMARNILEMRAAGRAGDVTEEMRAAADPMYMYQNTPLPMDEASRMARADQYWPDDAYHATGSDFFAFDPLKRGTATDSGWFGDAEYFSPKPEYAAKFAPVTTDSANIIPVRLNRGSVYDWRAMEADRGGRGVGNNRDASLAARARLEGEGFDSVEVSNLILRGDITDELWAAMVAADPQVEAFGRDNVARSFGAGIPKDSLKPYFNKEMLDLVPVQRDVEEIAIFDPRNIRSRFALFDPEFRHLRNLSAGIGGLGLLATQMPEQQRDEEIRQYLGGLL